MKITKTQLSQIVQEELSNTMSESEQWAPVGHSRKASDMYQLGRDDYGAFSAEEPTDDGVELDGERYPDDKYYAKGWRDNQEEYAQDVEDDSFRRDPAHDYDDDSHEEVVDDDWMWENKITKKGTPTMKVTKTQLKRIIKEELEAIAEEDAQGGFIRGAQGAGQDTISVDKIRISSDGSFKAKVSSAQLKKPLRVAGQLDHNSTALLQQAGALEKAKVTPLQKELNDLLDEMISAYDGAEVPPPLSIMKGLFNDNKHAEAAKEVTNLWNKLLKYHQRTGTRLQHRITTSFNTLNTLMRKLD